MTPMRIFRRNIKNDKLCSSLFAIFTYIGCTTINVLLELNFYPVTRRGFFCNDNSIKYPYQEQSISSRLNTSIHFGAAIVTFIIGEFINTCATDIIFNIRMQKMHLVQVVALVCDSKRCINI